MSQTRQPPEISTSPITPLINNDAMKNKGPASLEHVVPTTAFCSATLAAAGVGAAVTSSPAIAGVLATASVLCFFPAGAYLTKKAAEKTCCKPEEIEKSRPNTPKMTKF